MFRRRETILFCSPLPHFRSPFVVHKTPFFTGHAELSGTINAPKINELRGPFLKSVTLVPHKNA